MRACARQIILLGSLVAGLGFGPHAGAGSVERLKSFVQQTQSARADFDQTVYDKDSRPKEQARGTMEFSRPGKFRWEYSQPYKQLIIGDGAKLWIWDADLNQVTVKPMEQAIGSSPAALLAGSNEIESRFDFRDMGSQNGLDWVEASPKKREGTIERVRMAFDSVSIALMELSDSFGQLTVIRFSRLEKNPKLKPELFQFSPPAGADVIRE